MQERPISESQRLMTFSEMFTCPPNFAFGELFVPYTKEK